MLREPVLARRFKTGLALGYERKGVETVANTAASTSLHAPLAAACSAAWSVAEATIGSGADQSEIVRWWSGSLCRNRSLRFHRARGDSVTRLVGGLSLLPL